MKQDREFMGLAIKLARRGEPFVSPNPMVGAVLVKGGKIIAQAWHRKFGDAHAESLAIERARGSFSFLKGATLYVNLEPCVSFKGKKTLACADAIVAAGISRVVIAIKDPNPRVCGRGIKLLKAAGISVDVGCLKKEAEELNEKFIKWITTGVPYVALKVAMSLDGKIATRIGDSKWITSDAARKYVHTLRDQYDAVLVGKNTVIKDNPNLAGVRREPLRVVLDSCLSSPLNARVFRDKNALVITTERAYEEKLAALAERGVRVKIFRDAMRGSAIGSSIRNSIKIDPLLRFLAKTGVSSVLVEGGSEIFGSFIDVRAFDKLYWFISPKLIGGKNAIPAVAGKGVSKLSRAILLKKQSVTKVGEDILIEAA